MIGAAERPATRFGVFIGQVGLSWPGLVERFTLADELGFDHAWLVDHLMPTDPPLDRPAFEAWTSLAAIAALTSRVRIGVLVSSNTFRHPSLLAKQAVTVDHVSRGRLILGVGTGWHAEEHRRFGIDFPPPAERVDRLEEALQVLDRLNTGAIASFEGRHYRLDGAVALPRPVQRPRIPILIAAHRPRMLRLAARYADIWDTFPTMDGTATQGVSSDLAERVAAFEAACAVAGRDPAAIRRSVWVGSEPLESQQAYIDFVERYRSLGFTDLMTALPPRDRWSTVREIATSLIPRIRATEVVPTHANAAREAVAAPAIETTI
jgi:alkanesulfonate monooxygenase SsuD/methylene tetrahydromethanopterin reductase-like flavin-dependent oxidoreductase (luciferase family)